MVRHFTRGGITTSLSLYLLIDIMNHKEYITKTTELRNQLEQLKTDYLEEHGFAIGTPVIFLGKEGGYTCSGSDKVHYVAQRKIGWTGAIYHDILPAKKDGTASKKGAFIYFCEKKHLQVQS